MTIASWKRCRIAQRALCWSPVPAPTLPGVARTSFSVSSDSDYSLITNAT